ncbi:hypothetical protein IWQ56_001327 [Coemansia nantahalensis]|nr:hypothetical protein IWQ56_001327 [Coemansia nantahalensis]
MSTQITLEDILAISQDGTFAARRTTIVDVRGKAEYDAGHIRGAHNLPVQDLPAALALPPAEFTAKYHFTLPAPSPDTALAVYCMRGTRTTAAAAHLGAYDDGLLLYLPGWSEISKSPSAAGQIEQA